MANKETMLITQALDERDFLLKKIANVIADSKFIAAIREKDTSISGVELEKYEQNAKSNWQSVNDLIDRYDRINRAITLSNAQLTIKFSNGLEMTKAEAIAKKKSFNGGPTALLLKKAQFQYEDAIVRFDKYSNEFDQIRNASMNNFLQSQKTDKLSDSQLNAIETFVKPNTPKMVDPLGIKELIDKLNADRDVFLAEVDTLIKVSNATNTIEF